MRRRLLRKFSERFYKKEKGKEASCCLAEHLILASGEKSLWILTESFSKSSRGHMLEVEG